MDAWLPASEKIRQPANETMIAINIRLSYYYLTSTSWANIENVWLETTIVAKV